MSKMIISSNVEITNLVKTECTNNGFDRFGEIADEGYNIVAFKKLCINNDNLVQFHNGDFIVSSGTLIFEETIGKIALESVYAKFNGNIHDVRKYITGNYSIVLKKGDYIYIFCEENNVFDVFYIDDITDWYVANSLFDLAENYSGDLDINEFSVIEQAFQYCIIGDETVFNKVKKLQGDELIEIDLKRHNLKVKKQPIVYPGFSSFDEPVLVDQFTKTIKEKTRIIATAFDDITLSMTGGLDSRLIFSSMVANGVKPKIVYGIGNSILTNTKPRDLEINKIYASKFKLQLSTLDWSTPEQFDEFWEKYMHKYGFLSVIYNSSNHVFSGLENIEGKFIDYGYWGETFRNRPWLEVRTEEYFSLDQFLDEFYINKKLKDVYSNYDGYRDHLKDKFKSITDVLQLNSQKIHKNDFQKIYNYWFKGAHARICNLNNLMRYSIAILSDYDINCFALQVPYVLKVDARFMLKSLKKISPEVLDVPFFSHCEDLTFNETKFKLEKSHHENKIFSIAKRTVKNKTLIQFAKYILYQFSRDTNTSKELKELIEKSGLKKDILDKINANGLSHIKTQNYEGITVHLAHYAQLIEIIKHIKEK